MDAHTSPNEYATKRPPAISGKAATSAKNAVKHAAQPTRTAFVEGSGKGSGLVGHGASRSTRERVVSKPPNGHGAQLRAAREKEGYIRRAAGESTASPAARRLEGPRRPSGGGEIGRAHV